MIRIILMTLILFAVIMGSSTVFGQDYDSHTDTNRAGLQILYGTINKYPNATIDNGGVFMLHKPLWYSSRRMVQADMQIHGILGVGGSFNVYPSTALSVGGYLHLFSWLSIEVRTGVWGGLQIGNAMVAPALGIYGGGGYVFRFWDDPRMQLRLALSMPRAFVLREDSGNDCPVCYGYYGVGLGFEMGF